MREDARAPPHKLSDDGEVDDDEPMGETGPSSHPRKSLRESVVRMLELDTLPEDAFGCVVRKRFSDGNIYDGMIFKVEQPHYNEVDRRPWYHVRYSDGDEESLFWEQLQVAMLAGRGRSSSDCGPFLLPAAYGI